MKLLQMIIRLLALISMLALILTQKAIAAIPLLLFSSISLGIMLRQCVDTRKNRKDN